jgi:tRNA (guanine-N7-)-methyltransferase
MRLRRNWQGEAELPGLPGVLSLDPAACRGRWQDIFGGDQPLHLEIGMGKGDFLLAMAAAHPRINFVGIEKAATVLFIAARKNMGRPLANLRFLLADAGDLEQYFGESQADRIYLNFSDPWPKKRHSARRLTHRDKLAIYRRILKPGGQIHFKTDQEALFDFSLEELVKAGWSLGKITRDLRHSGFADNVLTEYERRFLRLGQPIYRLEAWNGKK